MTPIHFIYAGSPDNGSLQSPYSITRNVHKFLLSKTDSLTYQNWDDPGGFTGADNCLLIGHPNYSHITPIWKAKQTGKPLKAKLLLWPFHHHFNENIVLDELAMWADRLLLICGPYWVDTIGNSVFAHWGSKVTRIDMAVEPLHFPRVKTSFNTPRRLLYVGSDTAHKNLAYLVEIMKLIPKTQLVWIGGHSSHPLARLPNVKVEGWQELNIENAKRIANMADIFVNVSISDANPTTILETASWGFPAAVSKSSGYWPHPLHPDDLRLHEIHLGNPGKAVKDIEQLLYAPDSYLTELSEHNSRVVSEKYNWDVFTQKIWSVAQNYL